MKERTAQATAWLRGLPRLTAEAIVARLVVDPRRSSAMDARSDERMLDRRSLRDALPHIPEQVRGEHIGEVEH